MGANNSTARGYSPNHRNDYYNYQLQNRQNPYYGYGHRHHLGYFPQASPYYGSTAPYYSSYGVPSTYVSPIASSYPSTYIPSVASTYTPYTSPTLYSSSYVPPVSSYSVSRDLSSYSSYYPSYTAPLTGLPEYTSPVATPLAIGYNTAPTYVNNYSSSLPPAYISSSPSVPLLGAPTYTAPTYTSPALISDYSTTIPSYNTSLTTLPVAPTYTSTLPAYSAPTYTSSFPTYVNQPITTTPFVAGTTSIPSLPSSTPFIPSTIFGSLPTSTDFNYAIPRQGYTLENPSQLYQGNFWQVGAPSPLSADGLNRIPSNYGLTPLQVPSNAVPETVLSNRNVDPVVYAADDNNNNNNEPEYEVRKPEEEPVTE